MYPDEGNEAIADAFQTALGRPMRDWKRRAEAVMRTVRPSGDTICGARATEPRQLVDSANVAMLKPAESREAWKGFSRSARRVQLGSMPFA